MAQPSKQHPPRVPPWQGKALGWAAPGKPFANASAHGNTGPNVLLRLDGGVVAFEQTFENGPLLPHSLERQTEHKQIPTLLLTSCVLGKAILPPLSLTPPIWKAR